MHAPTGHLSDDQHDIDEWLTKRRWRGVVNRDLQLASANK